MKVEVAVLADYANLAEGGKLNVVGMFDHIWAPQFPTIHPFMVLALRMRAEYEDRGSHVAEIRLEDEDGALLGGGKSNSTIGAIPPGSREVVSQILPFAGIVFPKAGEYRFTLLWDGQVAAEVPLTVVLADSAPPAALGHPG